jgi:hypothetical protein
LPAELESVAAKLKSAAAKLQSTTMAVDSVMEELESMEDGTATPPREVGGRRRSRDSSIRAGEGTTPAGVEEGGHTGGL